MSRSTPRDVSTASARNTRLLVEQGFCDSQAGETQWMAAQPWATSDNTYLTRPPTSVEPDEDVLAEEAAWEEIEAPTASHCDSITVTSSSPPRPSSPELFCPPYHRKQQQTRSSPAFVPAPDDESQARLIDDTQNHPFFHPPPNLSNSQQAGYTEAFSAGLRYRQLEDFGAEVNHVVQELQYAARMGDVKGVRRCVEQGKDLFEDVGRKTGRGVKRRAEPEVLGELYRGGPARV